MKRRNGSKHDKTGCLACRYRHKKCLQNTFPTCGSCQRLNLECVREPIRQVIPHSKTFVDKTSGEYKSSAVPTAQLTGASHGWQLFCVRDNGDLPQRRHVMSYYVTVLTRLLTVSEQYNSFLLSPDMESSTLADALVAWASGHLSSIDKSFTITALQARSTAISSLAKDIFSARGHIAFHESLAASCLVPLSSDVCSGDRTSWYHHLAGAKHLIVSASAVPGKELANWPEAFKRSPEGQWILRNFAYHDIIGSVTLGTKPLICGNYLDGVTDVVDTYLGVASEILMFISEISCLNAMPPIVYDGCSATAEQDIISCQEKFLVLERKIQDWKWQADSTPSLGAVAYAYRSAALIYLYRWMRSRLRLDHKFSPSSNSNDHMQLLGSIHAKIGSEVRSILSHISTTLPPGAVPESALLFPLFLADGGAMDSHHIDMIRMRLQLSLQKRHFQNISLALGVLEKVWDQRQRDSGLGQDSAVDWKVILESKGGGLLLT